MPTQSVFKPKRKVRSIWTQTGIPSRGNALYKVIHDGLPMEIYKRLSSVAGMEVSELAQVTHISPATLNRRRKSGRLNADESDRAYRFAQVLQSAVELFEGDEDAAREWIKNPVRGLGNVAPVSMLSTHAETEAVLTLINRLEHGIIS